MEAYFLPTFPSFSNFLLIRLHFFLEKYFLVQDQLFVFFT